MLITGLYSVDKLVRNLIIGLVCMYISCNSY